MVRNQLTPKNVYIAGSVSTKLDIALHSNYNNRGLGAQMKATFSMLSQ